MIAGDTATLPLRPLSCGLVTIVDTADSALVAPHHWWAVARPDGHGFYAARWLGAGSTRRTSYLHRELAQAPAGCDVIHLNDDDLDNRRANLVVATRSQSSARRRTSSSATGFRGVYRNRSRYQAQITVAGKSSWLGLFATAEEAARAYDEAAQIAFGRFARLNFGEFDAC